MLTYRTVEVDACTTTITIRIWSSEISCGIFPEISGKITVLFRNNSAKNFEEVCGGKFHETLMQL